MPTRPIEVKWNDRCKTCGGTIMKGTAAAYDDAARKIYHNTSHCIPREAPDTLFPDPRQNDLADRLNFEKPEEKK